MIESVFVRSVASRQLGVARLGSVRAKQERAGIFPVGPGIAIEALIASDIVHQRCATMAGTEGLTSSVEVGWRAFAGRNTFVRKCHGRRWHGAST